MDAKKVDNMTDARDLAAELAKLPEHVLQRIMFLIEDAQLLEDAKKAG